MKCSKMLKSARPAVAEGEFICIALDEVKSAYHDEDNSVDVFRKLRDWIQKLLDDEYTLEDWLVAKHGINASSYDRDICIKMKHTRMEWLEWMIKYWEKKEKKEKKSIKRSPTSLMELR